MRLILVRAVMIDLPYDQLVNRYGLRDEGFQGPL